MKIGSFFFVFGIWTAQTIALKFFIWYNFQVNIILEVFECYKLRVFLYNTAVKNCLKT